MAATPKIPAAVAMISLLRGILKEYVFRGLTTTVVVDKNRARDKCHRPKHCEQVHERPGAIIDAGLKVLIASYWGTP